MEIMFTSRAWVRAIPCGRARMSKTGHMYTPKTTREFQNALREQWALSYKELLPISRDIPLRADIIFGFAPAKGCTEDLGNPVIKHNIGDLDNLVKNVLDSCISIVLEDDCSIVELRCAKFYSSENFVKITLSTVDKFDFLGYIKKANDLDVPLPNDSKLLKGKMLDKFVDHSLLGVDALYDPKDYISEEDTKSKAVVAWAKRIQQRKSKAVAKKTKRKTKE